MVKIYAVVAMDQARVIGVKNGLPWDLPEDRKHFADLTRGHTVLMGRKTYESLPAKHKPLKNRINVVVTRSPEALAGEQGIVVRTDPRQFLLDCKAGREAVPSGEVWVVGGEQIYRETMELWDGLELTQVQGTHDGDAYFPEYSELFTETSRDDRPDYSFISFKRQAGA